MSSTKSSVMKMLGIAACASLLLSACGGYGNTADTSGDIVLSVSDHYPTSHPTSVSGIQFWMDRVTALTDGKVTFKHYPAEELGKADDQYELLTTGSTDLAAVTAAYRSDKLPLSGVPGLPGLHETACQGNDAFWNVSKEGGALYEAELEPLGLEPIFTIVTSPYEFMTTGKSLQIPQDARGTKIRSAGGTFERVLASAGATPVSLGAPETYESMQRGVIDGTLFTYGSVNSYSLDEVIKYATDGVQAGSSSGFFTMTRATWDGLPADVQDAMRKAGEEANASNCKELDEQQSDVIDSLKKSGIEIHSETDEEKALWRTNFDDVISQWLEKDIPDKALGEKVVQGYKDAASSAGSN